MDYLAEKRREAGRMQDSGSVEHHRERSLSGPARRPEGYRGKPYEEANASRRPRELSGLGSSYANVSISANRKKEMFLSVNERNGYREPALKQDRKHLEGARRHEENGSAGKIFTNSFSRKQSAFALKTAVRQPEERILREIRSCSQGNGQTALRKALPFLNLEQDRRSLRENRDAVREAGEQGTRAPAAEAVCSELQRMIREKEQRQNSFMKKLRFGAAKSILLQKKDDGPVPASAKAQPAPETGENAGDDSGGKKKEKRPANKSQALKSKSDCLFQQSQKGCSKAGRQRRECCRSHENSV